MVKKMKKTLAVSIMTANQLELKNEIDSLKKAGINWLHCDVMDGVFVDNLAMGPYLIEQLKKDKTLILDVHLATVSPEKYIKMFGKLQPDYITFHIETTDNPEKIIHLIKSFGIKVGVAISPETSFDAIIPILNQIDLILVMTVNPGFAGQKFNFSVLDKLRQITNHFQNNSKRPIIQVDGNINAQTLELMKNFYVDLFVLGTSALYNNSSTTNEEKISKLKNILNNWEV